MVEHHQMRVSCAQDNVLLMLLLVYRIDAVPRQSSARHYPVPRVGRLQEQDRLD